MGYTTEFYGQIEIVPALNAEEIEAQGEDRDDMWELIVRDNKVTTAELVAVRKKGSEEEV